jgi:hypothetical protein
MRRELHQIPPAPRTPRWPPVLWARWPLAFLAFLGAVYGGVITLMFFYAWGGHPSDDRMLDRVGVRAAGKVTEVEPAPAPAQDKQLAWVRYEFPTPDGQTMPGQMYVAGEKYAVGQQVVVEFVATEPHRNRLLGERLSRIGNLSAPLWRWFVLPGQVALVLWFLGVLHTRRLLRRGDVGLAELLDVRSLPFVLPGMLRVSYRFRDHRARQCYGTHWVRARSHLGGKLTATPPPKLAPLVHDRLRPWRSRLVTVDDFVLAPVARNKHAADAPTPWTHDP